MRLNDRIIRGLKTEADRLEVSDDGHPLWLVVHKSGKKVFVWRGKLDGKTVRRSLGEYPAMALADARLEAMTMKRNAKEAAPKRPAALQPITKGLTVDECFKLYMAAEGDAKKTAGEIQRLYDHDFKAKLGKLKIKELTKAQVREIIDHKSATTKLMGNKCLGMFGRFLNWCVEEDHLENSPASSIKKPQAEIQRKIVFTKEQTTILLQTIHHADDYAKPFEFALRTLVRVSNILDLTWSMVDDEVITIPETKNDLPHNIFINAKLRELLPKKPEGAKRNANIWGYAGPQAEISKPYQSRHKRWRKESIKVAEKMELELVEADNGDFVSDWRIHDFRGTGSTYLEGLLNDEDEQRFPRSVTKSLLAHKDQGVTAEHYSAYTYFAQRKRALMAWGEYLDRLTV